ETRSRRQRQEHHAGQQLATRYRESGGDGSEQPVPSDAGEPATVDGGEAGPNPGARERATGYLQIPPRRSAAERRAPGANRFGKFRLRLPESAARVLDRKSRFRKSDRRRQMNTKQLLLIINLVALIALTIGCKTKAEEKIVKPVKVTSVETHTGANVVRY